MSSVAYALPQGGSVVEGDATITYGENSVTIEQNSAHVIIEWDTFDTAAGESVHFDQAEFMAALNRILSGQATRFDGALTGAGSITIVNQAGIAFGAGANVDVGAITATTLDIINANFMADNLVFDQYDSAFADASVTNDGAITVSDQGLAALVGPGVANNGIIQARTGAVVLASGTAATIDFYGDGLINFAVTGATEAAPVDADGNPLDALVSNSGAIYADGGTVILAAEAVGGIVDHAINMDGVIQAQSIAGRNGQIALVAGDGAGDVQVAGTLDASGVDAGTTGGTVHVLGDTVALNAGADVNVSGATGGGQALVGGSYQGGENVGSGIQYTQVDSVTTIIADSSFDAGGYVPTSDIAYVADGAGINVRATDNGDGGSAYVWGDQAAAFYGELDARGGDNGGDGGFVEISSAGALGYAGTVDTSAAHGQTGRLLLDPQNVLLGTVNPVLMGLNILADAASGGTFPFLVIDQQSLANTLYSTDVDLWASNSIVTLEAIDVSTARDVVVGNAPFSPPGCWNIFGCAIFGDAITTNDLTLSAPTVSILHDFTLGTGNLEVADLLAGTSIVGLGFISAPTDIMVSELNLDGRIHMRSTVGGATSLAGDAQINTDADTINILSNSALIQQGIHFAQAGATVNVGDGTYIENVVIDKNIALLSQNGRAATTIEGISGVGSLGTVLVTNNTSGVEIGRAGQGLTIIGIDNGAPGIENAAVYFQGNHSDAQIVDNEITANGEAGLLTEYGATISGFVIDGNEFSGQTFVGPNPAGDGFSQQFTLNNVPRQLVVMGGGTGGGNTSDTTFTNNVISGTAGGLNGLGDEQGNSLVTIDSVGATITGNTFAGTTTRFGSSLRARGTDTVISGNTFHAAGLTDTTNHLFVHSGIYTGLDASDPNSIVEIFEQNDFVGRATVSSDDVNAMTDRIGLTIQGGVGESNAGATVFVNDATYVEHGQILIDKDLTIIGTGAAKPIVMPGSDFAGNNAADAWIFVDAGVTFELNNIVLDGIGHNVGQALRNHGNTTVSGVDFRNILGATYRGIAIASYGGTVAGGSGSDSHAGGGDASTLLVEDSTFDNIGRIGVLVKGTDATTTIEGSAYTGKGDGNHLDYAFEAGAGASLTVLNSSATGNTGVASDGSTSAGVLATTYYGAGTSVVLGGSTLDGNTTGVSVGFDAFDSTSVQFLAGNQISGGDFGLYLNGVDIDIVGDTLSDIVFSGQSTRYVSLINGAEFQPGEPTVIDATAVSFDGVTSATATPAEFVDIENMIDHFVDTGTDGLINFGAVVVQSGGPLDNSIQLAVNLAGTANIGNVVVPDGTYGGNVEVWVDDLKVSGLAGAIIDITTLDAHSNFAGDRNVGFAVENTQEFDDNTAVVGVSIDPFIFTGDNNTDVGITLGHGNSAAVDTSVLGNTFEYLKHGIQSTNTSGTTTIAGNTMSNIRQQGIRWQDEISGGEDVILSGNDITSRHWAVYFIEEIHGDGTTVLIDDNSLVSTARDGIVIAEAIRDGALVRIVNNTEIRGALEGIDVDQVNGAEIIIADNLQIVGESEEGIEFDDLISNGASVTVSGNHEITGVTSGIGFLADDIAFGAGIVDSSVLISGNNSGISGGDFGILFADAIDNADVDILGNIINSDGDGIAFQSTIDGGSFVDVDLNSILAENVGINFADTIGHAGDPTTHVTLVDNTIGADGNEVLNGILFERITNASISIYEGRIDSAAGNDGPIDGDGINFQQGLHSGASVSIADVTIVSDTDEAIDFHSTIRNNASATIDGGSYTGGNNGVEFGAIAGSASIYGGATIIGQGADKRGVNLLGSITGALHISDSTITGTDDGIGSNDSQNNTINGGTFSVTGSTVTGTNGDGIELGAVSNGATVEIFGNPEINGGDNGVNFTGVVTVSTVNIADNNAGIFAANHGILFSGALTNSDIDILDNIIVAGTQANANGDGVHVAAAVDGSHIEARRNDVTVGQNTTASNTTHDGFYFGGDIVGSSVVVLRNNEIEVANAATGASTSFGDMGIRFDGFINTNGGNNADIRILDNVINAGIGTEDRGISFWNGIGGASRIEILRNTIAAGDDGIGVFDIYGGAQNQSLRGTSELVIADNIIGTSGARVGTANNGDGNGIDFQSVTGAAQVVIDNNSIFANMNAIEFDKIVNTTFAGNGVEITNNTNIDSLREDGIQFAGGVSGSNVLIQGNNDGIFAADHGISFLGAVANATLNIHDNIIRANLDNDAVGAGIFFGAGVTGTSSVLIGDGTLNGAASNIIAVNGNSGGSVSDNDGILFVDQVADQVLVLIDGNRIGYTAPSLSGLLTVQAVADDGVEFRGGIAGDADVALTDNRIHAMDDGVQITGSVGGNALLTIGETASDPDGNKIWAGDDGISFLSTLTGQALVDINNNRIDAGSDGILFAGLVNNALTSATSEQELFIHHNAISGDDNGINFAGGIAGTRHDTRIADNSLIEGLGENGIRVAGGVNDAEVRIHGNGTIFGDEDGIDFIGSVTNRALVEITGNWSIVGDGDDGIDFENTLNGGSVVRINGNHGITGGSSNGIEFAAVNGGAVVEIVGNNDGIMADDNGVSFGAVSGGADIDIHDNIIQANLDNGVYGSGVAFTGTVSNATINIGDGGLNGNPSNIIAVAANTQTGDQSGLDGIRFHENVGNGAVILIDGNRIGYTAWPLDGAAVADDGVEFAAGVNGNADIAITDNRINARDDGVQFSGTVGGYATIVIGETATDADGNKIWAGDDGISFLSDLTGHATVDINHNYVDARDVGVYFAGAVNNAVSTSHPLTARELAITYNDIFAGNHGIVFGGAVSNNAHDTLIANNHNIVGYDGDGIRYDQTVEDAEIWILENNDGIDAGDDGIQFLGDIEGSALITIADNRIVADDNGVEFRGDIEDNASIVITDNAGWNGRVQRGIFAGGNGIVFGGEIEDHSSVLIGGWDGRYPDGNTILAREHGVVFEDDIHDNAQVEISYNLIRGGYDWRYDYFRSSNWDGIRFEGATSNTGHGDFDIAIVGNSVTGSGNGINFLADVNGAGHDVYIGSNDWIQGLDGDGIRFEDDIDDEAEVRIVYNTYIKGSDDGIDFDNNIEEGAYVKIWGNDFIIGYDGDGIQFSDGVDDATVLVGGNYKIWGAEDGIDFDGAVEDGAYVSIVENRYIIGDDGDGIEFSEEVDDATVRIADNYKVWGDENGIDFDDKVEDGSFVKIWDNRYILGYDGDGVEFSDDVEDSTVWIADNYKIWGQHNGIEFDGFVEDGSFVKIWDNRSIVGDWDNGIAFNGIFDHDTDVVIGHNRYILGEDNGIYLARASNERSSRDLEGLLSDLLGEGWAIDGASVSIVGNHKIDGHDDNGILVEGVRGNWRNRDENLLIAWNDIISGDENGIHLAHGVDFDLGMEYLWRSGQFAVDLDLGLWAIDSAQVAIVDNWLIKGDDANGILVDGVKDGDFGSFGYSLFDRTELVINDNFKIIGEDNGIEIGFGFDLDVLAKLGLDYRDRSLTTLVSSDARSGPMGMLSSLDGLSLDGLVVSGLLAGISGAEVEIGYNNFIIGERDNGILVHGIFDRTTYPTGELFDEEDFEETDLETAFLMLPDFEPSATWNLDIHDNDVILGRDNGILLDQGYHLFAKVFEPRYDYATVTSSLISEGGSELGLFLRLDAWAISGGNARIADNWMIYGDRQNGIQVNGIRDGGVDALAAFENDGEVTPVQTDPDHPNLLIADNTSIIGGRDGINFGTGLRFELSSFGPIVTRDMALIGSESSFGGFDGPFGYELGSSVSGGLVVIDRNGEAEYEGGEDYDPEIPVVLSELDFGDGITGNIGRVIGINGDGIDFTGAIEDASTVQIQRNMLTGSGDNGIEFARIGEPYYLTRITSLSLTGFDGPYSEYEPGPTNVFVHNNFILDNGQNLVEEEFDESPTELTVSLASVGHHNVTGAGILFEEGVGYDAYGQVFQNYIAGNGGPGIQIGFPELEVETDSIEARFLSDYGYDGPISAANLEVVHNYIPGPVDLEDDRPNGTFAIANFANDGSTLFAQENWWGTTSPAGVAASFTGPGLIDYSSYLADGVDSNEERDPGLTGLSPFAFQPGEVFVPSIIDEASLDFLAEALLLFIASQTSPDLAPGDQLAGRTARDSANTDDNPFGDPYGFLDTNTDLANLAPAAGGESCRLVGIPGGVRLTCGGGGGAGGLAGLAPAAGGQNNGSGAPQGGPAFAPSLSDDLQNLLDMWLGLGLGAQPVADAGATPDQQAALMVPALQVATLQ